MIWLMPMSPILTLAPAMKILAALPVPEVPSHDTEEELARDFAQ